MEAEGSGLGGVLAGEPPQDDRLVQVARYARWIGAIGTLAVGAYAISARHVRAPGSPVTEAWDYMTSSTAAAMIVLAGALLVFRRSAVISAVLAAAAIVLAASALLVHAGAADRDSPLVPLLDRGYPPGYGLMSIQTAAWVLVMSATVASGLLPRWQRLTNGLSLLLIWFTTTLVVFRIMGTEGLIGQSGGVLVSLPTATAMMLLAVAWVAVWSTRGGWRTVLNRGVAALTLRWLAVAVLLASTGAAFGLLWMLDVGRVPLALAVALVLVGFLLFGLVGITVLYQLLRHLEVQLRLSAVIDSTTGLLNQSAFAEFAPRALCDARRQDGQVTLLVFDLDGLKHVNDTLGHAAGTEVIARFGRSLSAVARRGDLPSRVGGDEFAVLLRSGTDDPDRAIRSILDRLDSALASAASAEPRPWRVGYSWGHATLRDEEDNLEALEARADEQMYRRKRGKRGQLQG